MQEERRQQQLRRQIAPIERPVERVELPGERERHRAEKRHREPEEMQRRLMIGPPHAHRRADEQRKNPDRRQSEIQTQRTRRNRLYRERQQLPLILAKNRVREPAAIRARMQYLDDVLFALDVSAVNRLQDVARPHTCARGSRVRRHFRRDDLAAVVVAPQHSVLDFRPRRPLDDVQGGQAEQRDDDEARRRRLHPGAAWIRAVHEYKWYPAKPSNSHTRSEAPAGYITRVFSIIYYQKTELYRTGFQEFGTPVQKTGSARRHIEMTGGRS